MEDEEAEAVLRAVGRQIKLWREAAGLKQTELGDALGYGCDLISAVERGKRIPRPDLLDKADEVLGAGGKISAMRRDVEQARYPKNVRDLAKLEDEAVEMGSYANHNMHGLLQTPEYTRALFAMRRPACSEEEIERQVAARVARQDIYTRPAPPQLTFVQEEVTLRRPIGGRMVLRQQLEHLLELARLRHVSIQVMPTDRDDHAGMGGPFRLLKLRDGSTLGHSEAQLHSRVINDPREVQILDMRYGMIRAQALSPRESLTFVEKVLEET
ncbi:helix-turn-helix domain-containing protein [Streptomyces sp. NPDC058867]|uniref:helix-turn-helix domain-containing protein n=1 Tax=unclassified Streptomyces TaxID=2593676 RepID=UPI0036C9643C